MNDTSSRSHAVFTITLIQTSKRNAVTPGYMQSTPRSINTTDSLEKSIELDDTITTISKLTFVDLAGSER